MELVAILGYTLLDRRISLSAVGGSWFSWSLETDDGYTSPSIAPHAGAGFTDTLVPRRELCQSDTVLRSDGSATGTHLNEGEFIAVTNHAGLDRRWRLDSCMIQFSF